MEFLEIIVPGLTKTQWFLHLAVFLVNISFFTLARPIVRLIDDGVDYDIKLRIFQFLNVLVFLLHVIDIVLLRFSYSYQNYFVNLGLSLAVAYTALFVHSFLAKVVKRRFGIEHSYDEKIVYIESYSSRLVSLILLVVIAVTAVYTLIKIWGADSMLETTGIIGILVAFAAFTSNIWAPDIVSGLIILNTRMLEDGDVVVIEGYPDEYIISKVTLIYVILYDVRNNHRTLIRNSQFTQRKIDNLSRVASTDGVRRSLVFNIAYPELKTGTDETVDDQLESYRNRIDRMFKTAFENCCGKKSIKINEKREFEWVLTNAGDYALEYTLWIYLDRIPNTKVTATIRKHLVSTRYKVNEAVFYAAEREGISLSTPTLIRHEAIAPAAALSKLPTAACIKCLPINMEEFLIQLISKRSHLRNLPIFNWLSKLKLHFLDHN